MPEDKCKMNRMYPVGKERRTKETGTVMILNSQMLDCQYFQNSVIRTNKGSS